MSFKYTIHLKREKAIKRILEITYMNIGELRYDSFLVKIGKKQPTQLVFTKAEYQNLSENIYNYSNQLLEDIMDIPLYAFDVNEEYIIEE